MNTTTVIIIIIALFFLHTFKTAEKFITHDIKVGAPHINYSGSHFNYVDPYEFIKHADYDKYPTEFYHHPYGHYYPYDKLV